VQLLITKASSSPRRTYMAKSSTITRPSRVDFNSFPMTTRWQN